MTAPTEWFHSWCVAGTQSAKRSKGQELSTWMTTARKCTEMFNIVTLVKPHLLGTHQIWCTWEQEYFAFLQYSITASKLSNIKKKPKTSIAVDCIDMLWEAASIWSLNQCVITTPETQHLPFLFILTITPRFCVEISSWSSHFRWPLNCENYHTN